MSQAEHDRMASAILITPSRELAERTVAEVYRQMEYLSRKEIIQEALERFGGVIVCESMDEAVDFANELAPEHLEICVDNPFSYIGRLDNAGSVFLGHYSPEPLGDYFAGPNHVLPHRRHRSVLLAPVGGRLHQEVQLHLLPQGGAGKGRAGHHPPGPDRGAHRPRQFHPGAGGGLRRRPCTS